MSEGIDLDLPQDFGDGEQMRQLCKRVTPVVEEYFDGHVMLGILPGQLDRSIFYMSNSMGRPELREAMEEAILAAAGAVREIRRKEGRT